MKERLLKELYSLKENENLEWSDDYFNRVKKLFITLADDNTLLGLDENAQVVIINLGKDEISKYTVPKDGDALICNYNGTIIRTWGFEVQDEYFKIDLGGNKNDK